MTTPICKVCFNELKENNLHELFRKDICICPSCLKAYSPKRIKDKIDGVSGEFLFTYNETIKEKIYTYKGCGDIELGATFLNYYKNELKRRYRGYILIPAPSNKEDDDKRGFNHVIVIFKQLELKIEPLIFKKEPFKQSSLNKKERENIYKYLEIKNIRRITNKKVLFVDDIFTTGSTLKSCLKLIKSARPKKIRFLIIAKVIK